MSIDYATKERAFLDALKDDTGRSLDEWLSLVRAEMLDERNDIIDWLRQQGFTFSRASWLERIHHNDGQPIYAGTTAVAPNLNEEPPTRLETSQSDPISQAPTATTETDGGRELKPGATPKQKPNLRVVASKPTTNTAPPKASDERDQIDQVLARAKGLRPLAQHVCGEIKSVVPDVRLSALKSVLVLGSGDTNAIFGLLAVSAKDLRLGLALPNEPVKEPFEHPRFAASHTRISQNITHMMVLDDVRQITPAVLLSVQNAATRA